MRDTSAQAILRERASRIEPKTGPPTHTADQQMRVLEILRDAGARGVYRELFLIPADLGGHGITQVATRINELRKQGCVIDSRRVRPEDAFVSYFLRFTPERLKELHPPSTFAERTRQLEAAVMPLFVSGESR